MFWLLAPHFFGVFQLLTFATQAIFPYGRFFFLVLSSVPALLWITRKHHCSIQPYNAEDNLFQPNKLGFFCPSKNFGSWSTGTPPARKHFGQHCFKAFLNFFSYFSGEQILVESTSAGFWPSCWNSAEADVMTGAHHIRIRFGFRGLRMSGILQRVDGRGTWLLKKNLFG